MSKIFTCRNVNIALIFIAAVSLSMLNGERRRHRTTKDNLAALEATSKQPEPSENNVALERITELQFELNAANRKLKQLQAAKADGEGGTTFYDPLYTPGSEEVTAEE